MLASVVQQEHHGGYLMPKWWKICIHQIFRSESIADQLRKCKVGGEETPENVKSEGF